VVSVVVALMVSLLGVTAYLVVIQAYHEQPPSVKYSRNIPTALPPPSPVTARADTESPRVPLPAAAPGS
jgi:hypothetical protein